MSAETLREAADQIRADASRVPVPDGNDNNGSWADECRHNLFGPDGEHAAKFGHPAVALAVADWLDETADHLSIETNQYADGSVCLAVDAARADCSIFQSALNFARTYLGEVTP